MHKAVITVNVVLLRIASPCSLEHKLSTLFHEVYKMMYITTNTIFCMFMVCHGKKCFPLACRVPNFIFKRERFLCLLLTNDKIKKSQI